MLENFGCVNLDETEQEVFCFLFLEVYTPKAMRRTKQAVHREVRCFLRVAGMSVVRAVYWAALINI